MQAEPTPNVEPTSRGAGAREDHRDGSAAALRPWNPRRWDAVLRRWDDPEHDPRRADERRPLDGPEEQRFLRRLRPEILIVLGLSLGQSAVYSIVNIIGKLTAGTPLADQTATLNASQSSRPYLDLTYQILDIAFTMVPVALAIWLLAFDHPRVSRLLGLDRHRPWRDLAQGAAFAALIGLPGLGLYFAGRALGITADVVASGLNQYWWTVPILILQAVKNAVLEEVIVVGYLVTRLRQLGWPTKWALAASAVLRGSYHLYQGFGAFVGNAVMGVIFGLWYRRGGRVMPLIVAHSILDIVSFVGYDLAGSWLGLKH